MIFKIDSDKKQIELIGDFPVDSIDWFKNNYGGYTIVDWIDEDEDESKKEKVWEQSEKQLRIHELEKDLTYHKQWLKNSKKENESLRSKLELSEKNDCYLKERRNNWLRCNADNNDQIEALTNELKAAEQWGKQQEEIAVTNKVYAKKLEEENKKLKANTEYLKKRSDEWMNSCKEETKEKEEFYKGYLEMKEERNAALDDVEELKNSVLHLNEKLAEKKDYIVKLNMELFSLQSKNESLEKKILEYDRIEEEDDKAYESHILEVAKLNAKILKLKARVKKLKNK